MDLAAPLPAGSNLYRLVTEAVAAVVAAGTLAARMGWVPATSGNFSCRIDEATIAITRSGIDKGRLAPDDVLIQSLAAPLLPRSSAEAPIHVGLYLFNPGIGAIFHGHSLGAAVLARSEAETGALIVEGWELQKALQGVTSHETSVEVPIFANDQDTAALSTRILDRLAAPRRADRLAPGFLLAGHGLYAYGATAVEASRHFEALETLFMQIITLRSITR